MKTHKSLLGLVFGLLWLARVAPAAAAQGPEAFGLDSVGIRFVDDPAASRPFPGSAIGVVAEARGQAGSIAALVSFVDSIQVRPSETYLPASYEGGGEGGYVQTDEGFSYSKSVVAGDFGLTCGYSVYRHESARDVPLASVNPADIGVIDCAMGWSQPDEVNTMLPLTHSFTADSGNPLVRSIIDAGGTLTLDGSKSYWASRIPAFGTKVVLTCGGRADCVFLSFPKH